MPEHRGRKHHQDRVAETLREEIGAMIEGELSDPRIAFCHVSEVVLNPGGKSARVYVAVDGTVPDIDKAEEDTLAALESAKGYIRFELKERMLCIAGVGMKTLFRLEYRTGWPAIWRASRSTSPPRRHRRATPIAGPARRRTPAGRRCGRGWSWRAASPPPRRPRSRRTR